MKRHLVKQLHRKELLQRITSESFQRRLHEEEVKEYRTQLYLLRTVLFIILIIIFIL